MYQGWSMVRWYVYFCGSIIFKIIEDNFFKKINLIKYLRTIKKVI
jgi:hypothetical protein